MELKNIFVTMEINLKFPYSTSFQTLIDFTNVWDLRLLGGGTKSPKAYIEVPWKKYKLLWKKNPKKGKEVVLNGMEHFITGITVLTIKTL